MAKADINPTQRAMSEYEELAEEKRELGAKQKDITTRLKDQGRSVAAFRLLVKFRKLEPDERRSIISDLIKMAEETDTQLSFDLDAETAEAA